MPEKQKAHP